MGKSTPAPPDPVATAKVQGAENIQAARESAKLNRTETIGPGYKSTWTNFDPGTGIPVTQIITLNPEEQALYTRAIGNARAAGDQAGNILSQNDLAHVDRINLAGLPQLFSADFGAGRGEGDALQNTEDAVFRRYARTLDPEQELQREREDTQLAVRGIPIGSEAWMRAKDRLDRSQASQRADARDAAVLAGNTLQNQLFNQSMARRQLGYNEQAAERSYLDQTLNQRLAALLAASQGGIPSVTTSPSAQMNISPVDIVGLNNAAFQANAANAASNNQATNAAVGATAAIAAAGLGAAGF